MAGTPIRVLDGPTVRELLPYPECVALMRKAMVATSAGHALLPLRQRMALPNAVDALGMMPGYLQDPRCFGIKLVSLFPGNARLGLSSHLGIYVLYEAEAGRPLAVMNAAEITAIRTAAASAVATLALMRPESTRLAILGAGEQAHAHIDALLAAHPFTEIVIWGRRAEAAEGLATAMRAGHADRPALDIRHCTDAKEAVAQADVVCTVTASRTPVLHGAWLRPGTHVNLVGASFADRCEIDEAGVVRGRYFADYRPSALAQADELLAAIGSGAVTESHIVAEIGAVLAGHSVGRSSDEEITLYKSLGVASQDLSAAWHVFEQAERRNLGVAAAL